MILSWRRCRIRGCRAVGIAGGAQKYHFVENELGFDLCLDHREGSLPERLKEACPNGIDIYFENVGGHVFDAVLPLLNNFARIPFSGLIAHYNATGVPDGPDQLPLLLQNILVKHLALRGFIISDFADQTPLFLADISIWLREGRVKYQEDITEGLENAPCEPVGLLRGKNFGKSSSV